MHIKTNTKKSRKVCLNVRAFTFYTFKKNEVWISLTDTIGQKHQIIILETFVTWTNNRPFDREKKKNRGKLQTEQQQMDSSSSKMVKFGKIHCLTFHVLTFGRCSFPGNQFGTHRTWCYLFYVSACTQILMNSFLQHLLLRKSQHDSKCSVVQASSCVSLWISILPQKALLQSDYEKLKKKENVWAFFLRQQSLHCYVLQ